jgi:hypothetical protein
MNLKDMISLVRARLVRQSMSSNFGMSQGALLDGEIKAVINNAMSDFCSDSFILRIKSTGTLDNGSLTIPDLCLKVLKVELDGTEIPRIQFTDSKPINKGFIVDMTSKKLSCLSSAGVGLTGTITIWMVMLNESLDGQDDTPDFDSMYHQAIVERSLYLLTGDQLADRNYNNYVRKARSLQNGTSGINIRTQNF